MKGKTLLCLLGIVVGVLVGVMAERRGWVFRSGKSAGEVERRVSFYQSPMHPWIKSDSPGLCTICGMKLVPVYEGEHGFDNAGGVVTLKEATRRIIGLRTAEVKVAPVERTLRVGGYLEDIPGRRTILASRVDGRFDMFGVETVGVELEAGDVLAQIYSPALLTAVHEYLAFTGMENRGARPGSSGAFDSGTLGIGVALRLRQLGLTEDQVRRLPETFTEGDLHVPWLAPSSGTVVKRYIEAGQYVKEGEPIVELADLTTLWFQFDAYEQELGWLEVGQSVEVTVPTLPGQSWDYPIAFIEPLTGVDSQRVRVRVEIPNPVLTPENEGGGHAEHQVGRRLFRRNLYAEGRVKIETLPVLQIPRSAVMNPDGKPVAYVATSEDTFERRFLKLRRSGDLQFEVLEGVEAGEKVLVEGALLVDAQARMDLGDRWEEKLEETDAIERGGEGSVLGAFPQTGTRGHGVEVAEQPWARWSDLGIKEITAFLAVADDVRSSLAKDDLAAFEAARTRLSGAREKLMQVSVPSSEWKGLVDAVVDAGELQEAADIQDARKGYKGFSEALLPLVSILRQSEPAFSGLRIYRCPMTRSAFTGAPRSLEWFQVEGPLRNPWFGSEMLECGTEIPNEP